MPDRDRYAGRSFEEQYFRERDGYREALELPQTLQDRDAIAAALSRAERQYALWKRLFGDALAYQFIGKRELFPVPHNWIRNQPPKAPFPKLEIDTLIQKLLARRRPIDGPGPDLDCPYWWVRWAIYRRFMDVERDFQAYHERRKVPQNLKLVNDAANKAEDALWALADALEDCRGIDVTRPDSDKSVQVYRDAGSWSPQAYSFDDAKLFNPEELSLPITHVQELREVVEQIRAERPVITGRGQDIRRSSFALAVGAMWWELAGYRPTASDPFMEFLAEAEQVFFDGFPTMASPERCVEKDEAPDVRRLAIKTVSRLKGLRLDHIERSLGENGLDRLYLARIRAARRGA